jgi:hypothetical protein
LACVSSTELLHNEVSTIDDALMMIEKYPAVLQYRNNGSAPLYSECSYRCRSSIISKCIELYTEGLNDKAINVIIKRVNQSNWRVKSAVLSVIFAARPLSLYPSIYIRDDIRQDPFCRRLILNLLPRHIFTPIHESDYRDPNWEPRAAMIILLLHTKMKIRQQQSGQRQEVYVHSAALCMQLG